MRDAETITIIAIILGFVLGAFLYGIGTLGILIKESIEKRRGGDKR